MSNNELGENRAKEKWDNHQFFHDLKFHTLDSLGTIIDLSDSIVAYNWNGNIGNPATVEHYIVDAYGTFDNRIEKALLLDNLNRKTLKKVLSDSTNFEGNHAMCFIPHIAFVYYYKSEIIGQSNVCFICSGVKSIPKSTTALSQKGSIELRELCSSIGLETIDDNSQLSY